MPYLVVENGNRRGLKVEIPANGKVVFGRDARNEIAVTDHLCSRRHFEVVSKNGQYVLEDLGSSNGTYVNDERSPDTGLEHGDCIQAGETQLTFLVEAEQGARGLVGKTVGGYRILERIGRGGMGTVYKANQTSLNRTIALKILSPKIAKDPNFVSKFHKEAQAAGRLNHPNIVQVYDVGSDQGLHFYSMEYIENGSVQDLATREGVVDPELALAITIDAARGLEYAEKKALVHRDIKPDNLMVNAEGVVKIADLGLARDAGHTARETGDHAGQHHEDDEGIFGTPHFIAPEQARGLDVDTRSDIYSLGASFYRLVTGETPFKGDTVREIVSKQVNDDPTPIRDMVKEVPGSIAQVIDKMMRKDPGERQQSATQLVEELERISGQLEGGSRRGLVAAASAAIAAVITAIVVISGNGGNDDTPVDPNPPPVNPTTNGNNDAKQQAVIDAMKELNKLRVDSAGLIGTARTEAALTSLMTRYQGFVSNHQPTPVWENADIARSKDALDTIRQDLAELVRAREEREAAILAKATAAKVKCSSIIKTINEAQAGERWAEGLGAIITGARAPELRDFAEHRASIQSRQAGLIAEATAKTQADRDSAAEARDAGDFSKATQTLQRRLDNLKVGLDDDVRLAELAALANAVEADIGVVAKARRKKAEADRAADQVTGLAARREAFGLLRGAFKPDEAIALLKLATQDLKTQAWKDLIANDLILVGALTRSRDGFLARMQAKPPSNDKIKLLNKTGVRLISYTLVAVDAAGFDVKLGSKITRHEYAEFKPTGLLERVFCLRPDKSATAAIDATVMLLLEGRAAEAEQKIAELGDADPAIVTRLKHESEAVNLVTRIRALEASAQQNDLDYLRLLPLVSQFLDDFRDTIAFALNSDGSTPVFVK